MTTKDKNIPKKLKMKGRFLKKTCKNSESIKFKFSYELYILPPKKGVPTPISISLIKKPTKIAPKESNKSGKTIKICASCDCCI
jgi:hypothetical protein